ncbi:MAG TPA: glycosyltransferase family 1 protein [bacterium]
MGKKRLFVDAGPLIDPHLSGVGHATYHLIDELSRDEAFTAAHEIHLVAPAWLTTRLARWNFPATVAPERIPVPGRVLVRLIRYRVLPPMDLLLGRGAYLFTNFANWPLVFSPSITYIHDVAFVRHPGTVEPSNLRYLSRNVPTWVGRATWIVTVSETAKREIAEDLHVDPARIVVAYNGVDRALYRRSDPARVAATKAALGIEGEYVLFVGNIEPRKNLLRLVQAFRALPEALTRRCSLVLVGGGGWLNGPILEAIAAARRDGCRIVRPERYVEDAEVVDLYSGARCSVLPSLHEGFGMPLLEALACGTRVVAADIGALREAGGDLPVYCDPLSAESIAEALRRTIESEPAADFARRAEEHVARFTWARTAGVIKGLIP